MKRKLLIAASIILLLTSLVSVYLNANSRKNHRMANINKVFVMNILQLPDAGARYKAYLALDEKEQCLLWETRLEEYMKNSTLSEFQVNTINKAIEILEPAMFVKENGSVSADAHFKGEDLKQQFIAAFGYETARQLIANLSVLKTRGAFVWDDCPCNSVSDWCSSGFKCWPTLCGQTSSGCGNFWLYPCDGSCRPNADEAMTIPE